VAPDEIANFLEGSSTKIIDYAKVPSYPSSPNLKQNCLLGALAGILIAVIYVTLRVLLDVRIKTDEDLTAMFDVPVLGQIPDFNVVQKKRKGYGQNGYATAVENREVAKK
jgi:capsular polysaccharide biosynthesis protein